MEEDIGIQIRGRGGQGETGVDRARGGQRRHRRSAVIPASKDSWQTQRGGQGVGRHRDGVGERSGGAGPETEQRGRVCVRCGPPTAPEDAPCPHHYNRECPSFSSGEAGQLRRASRPDRRSRGPVAAAAPAAATRSYRTGPQPRAPSRRPPSSLRRFRDRACASRQPRPRTTPSGTYPGTLARRGSPSFARLQPRFRVTPPPGSRSPTRPRPVFPTAPTGSPARPPSWPRPAAILGPPPGPAPGPAEAPGVRVGRTAALSFVFRQKTTFFSLQRAGRGQKFPQGLQEPCPSASRGLSFSPGR